jgi:GPH family glycoside/pentoside/hexuronide:cation symporter
MFLGLTILGAFSATIPWVIIAKRFGKKRTWISGMLIQASCFTIAFFLGKGDAMLFMVISFFIGVGSSCGSTLSASVVADVIDYDEWLSGKRKEGAYYAVYMFIYKAAFGISLLLIGLVLQSSGFQPNVEQTEATQFALRALFGLVPLSFYIVGLVAFSFYRFNEAEHSEIRIQLKERIIKGSNNA